MTLKNTGFPNMEIPTSFMTTNHSEFSSHDDIFSRQSRTPSPTPSELRELNSGAINWKTVLSRRFWIRKEWTLYYLILVVIVVVVALMTIYHTQIVHWLTPVATWLRDRFTFGWLVPIVVLFVISFPPLFGHEIVAILCGLVWGLWAGFGIVAAGTFLGEVGNYYAFRYCCRTRGEKAEKTNIFYACLARVVRHGGFKIALIVRLSAIPGHFTTAVFSACGMGIVVFSLAAILSMPKQLIIVYLGVILEESATGSTRSRKSRIISNIVLAITILITAVAMWYILHKIEKVKPQVLYDRRKARQAKLHPCSPYSGSSYSMDVFNPDESDVNIPLIQTSHQHWDDRGAIGHVPDPSSSSRSNHNCVKHLNNEEDPSNYPPTLSRPS